MREKESDLDKRKVREDTEKFTDTKRDTMRERERVEGR